MKLPVQRSRNTNRPGPTEVHMFQKPHCLKNTGMLLMSLCLLQDKGRGKGLVKNAALEEQDAQNLEVVAFCEDVAR